MKTYLVAWENKRVSQNNILPTASCKHNDLGNVFWCQRLNTTSRVSAEIIEYSRNNLRVDSISLCLVSQSYH